MNLINGGQAMEPVHESSGTFHTISYFFCFFFFLIPSNWDIHMPLPWDVWIFPTPSVPK